MRIVQFYAIIILSNVRCEGYEVVADVQREEFIMLRRKVYNRLLRWKSERQGKTAVLLKGARRVGKSTLVEAFGKNEYASCLIIDFFQAPAEVKAYFEDYRAEFDTLFLYLQAFYGVDLVKRKSLVVFDEV